MAPESTGQHLETGKQEVFRLATVVEKAGKISIKKEDWETFAHAATKAYEGKSIAIISTIGGGEDDKTRLLNLLIQLASERSKENAAKIVGQNDGKGALAFEKNGLFAVIPHFSIKSTTSQDGTTVPGSVGLIFLHSAYYGQNHRLHQELFDFCVQLSASVTFLDRFGGYEDSVFHLLQLLIEYTFEDMNKKICPATAIFLHKPDDGSFAGFETASEFITQYYDSSIKSLIGKNIWGTVCSLRDATVSLRCALTEGMIEPYSGEDRGTHELNEFLAKIFDRFDGFRLFSGDIAEKLKTAFNNALARANLETDRPDEDQGDVGGIGDKNRPHCESTSLASCDKSDAGGETKVATVVKTTAVLPSYPHCHKQSKANDPNDDNPCVKEKEGLDLEKGSSDFVVVNKSDVEEQASDGIVKTAAAPPSVPPLDKKSKSNQPEDDGTCVDEVCQDCVKTWQDPLQAIQDQEENDTRKEDRKCNLDLTPNSKTVHRQTNDVDGFREEETPQGNVKIQGESRNNCQNYNKHRSKTPDPVSGSTAASLQSTELEKNHDTRVVTESLTGSLRPSYSHVAALGSSPYPGNVTAASSQNSFALKPQPTTSSPQVESAILNLMASSGMVTMEIAETQLQIHFLQTLALFSAYAMNPEQLHSQIEGALGQWTAANTGLLAEHDAEKLQTTFRSMKRTLNDIFDYYQEYRRRFETFFLHSLRGIWTDLEDAKRQVESKLPYPDLRTVHKHKKMIEKALDTSINWMWSEQSRRQEQTARVEALVAKRARNHALESYNEVIKTVLARGVYCNTNFDDICYDLEDRILTKFNKGKSISHSPVFERAKRSLEKRIVASSNEGKRINQLQSVRSTKNAKAKRKHGLGSVSNQSGGHTHELNANAAVHTAGNFFPATQPSSHQDNLAFLEKSSTLTGGNSYHTDAKVHSNSSETGPALLPRSLKSNDLEELANAVRELETVLPSAKPPVAKKAKAQLDEAKQLLSDANGGAHKVKTLVQTLQMCIKMIESLKQ